MEIRKTTEKDLPAMMEIFADARELMASTGNPTQWVNYPTEEIIRQDMEGGHSYIIEENGRVEGTFAFIPGEDPTYRYLIEGEWLNDAPYAVIHRLAGRKGTKGIAEACFSWAFCQCGNIRVDTHQDNAIMRHIITSYGFTYCGIVSPRDNSRRLVYQKCLR